MQALYCDHLMDNMELCCCSKRDPRLLLVTAIDEHTGVHTHTHIKQSKVYSKYIIIDAFTLCLHAS